MKIGYFALTEQGFELVQRLNEKLPGEIFPKTDLKQNIADGWERLDGLVCVMAAGIVVRYIAPLLKGKDKDPAVIVVDTRGRWVVSLLSGHLGGANALAGKLAEVTGGQAVVTTATDTEGITAFDEVAKKNRLLIENLPALKYVSAKQLDKEEVSVVIDPFYIRSNPKKTLYLRPQTLVLGVGCKKAMAPERMQEAFLQFAEAYIPDIRCIRGVATVDIKAGEKAILSLAGRLAVPMMVISRNMIAQLDFNRVPGGPLESSPFVEKTLGIGSVAEASAYIAAKSMAEGRYDTGRMPFAAPVARLKIKKQKYEGITFAVAEMVQTIDL
jgi:cobalt-precorrin 5A hydrolase